MTGTVPASSAAIRPKYRGVIHRWAAVAALPVFAALILAAPDRSSTIAVFVHAVGVVGMLGVSATYHSGRLSPRAFRLFKRLDHSTILLAIGGTYTAVTVLALEGNEQTRMLLVIGIGAVVGIALRLTWIDAPYPVTAAVYLIVGWSALVDLPAYLRGTTTIEFVCIASGGVLYTVGGVIYALHRPNLWPATFGYHELFHALVVAGAVSHIAAVGLLL